MTAATIAAPARPEEILNVPAAAPGCEVALGFADDDGCGGMVTVLFPEVLLPLPLFSCQRNGITKEPDAGKLTLIQVEGFQS